MRQLENACKLPVAVSGALLRTTTQGHGPPLVLCHGGPGDWDDLGAVAGMLDDRATVHRYDQRACGRASFVTAKG